MEMLSLASASPSKNIDRVVSVISQAYECHIIVFQADYDLRL